MASPESSTPLEVLDCEFTYAPKPDAAAAAAGTPSCGNTPLLTNSIRSRNSLVKYARRSRPRPPASPCSMPTSTLRLRSGPMGPMPKLLAVADGTIANSDDSS